jgi:hypothetical protein
MKALIGRYLAYRLEFLQMLSEVRNLTSIDLVKVKKDRAGESNYYFYSIWNNMEHGGLIRNTRISEQSRYYTYLLLGAL